MKFTHLRRQLLLLALLPATLIAGILSAYQIDSRLDTLDGEIRLRMQAVANHFATISEYPVYSGDVSTLTVSGIEHLLTRSVEFEYAAVRTNDNVALIEYGSPLLSLIDMSRLPAAEGHLTLDDNLIYHHPVISQGIHPGNVLDPALELVEVPVVSGWVSIQYSLERLQQQRRTILVNSISITLVGLLLGALLAVRLGARIDGPINRLVDTVRRLGRGELSVRAELDQSGEIGALERGINLMANSLEQSHQQLRQEVDLATTDLQRSLHAVSTHERRYRDLVQNIGCLIIQVDAANTITFINQHAEEYFGLRDVEVLDRNVIGTIISPQYAEEFAEAFHRATHQVNPIGRHLGPNGERRYVNWSIRTLTNDQGEPGGSLAVGIDITERHRFQRAIGILAEAEVSIEALYPMVSRAIGIGLDYRWAGIALASPDQALPALMTIVEFGQPVEMARLDGLQAILAEILADGDAVELVTGLPTLYPVRDPGSGIEPRTLFAVPFGGEGRPRGVLFAIDSRANSPSVTGRHIVQLCAKRLDHSLQLEEDARQLTIARDAALAATESKTRFLANVSHEIRTPMNGIIGFANLLLRQSLQPRQRHHVDQISQSARSLLNIINDILDISRAEAGKLFLKPQAFDPVETLETVVGAFAASAYSKGLELCYLLDDDTPARIVTDPLRFQQILENLVGNALKFTEQGHVQLTLGATISSPGTAVLRIEVTDTGAGIEPDDQVWLFEAFSRVERSPEVPHEGTGLGLSICHQLVTLLGGEIGVDSQPGQGSSFWFTLPVQTAPHAESSPSPLVGMRIVLQESDACMRASAIALLARADIEVEAVATDDELHTRLAARHDDPYDLVVLTQSSGEPAAHLCAARIQTLRESHAGRVLLLTRDPELVCPPGTCDQCADWCAQKPLLIKTLLEGIREPGEEQVPVRGIESLTGLRVLVVEDNDINRLLITTLLHEAGLETREARDGEEALRLATSMAHDLILMDMQMPRLGGAEALERIRAILGDSMPPIIALTANATGETRLALLGAGFADVLDKPIDETRLWQTIADQIRRSHASSRTGTASASASASAYDAAAAIAISGGQHALALQMAGMFFKELPQHRAALEEHWQAQEMSALRAALHKLGGSANYCAMHSLAEAIRVCEQHLGEQDPAACGTWLKRVLAELDSLTGFDYGAALEAAAKTSQPA